MTTHPETIEHEGRTYRLVPDEAEQRQAAADREREHVLRRVEAVTSMPPGTLGASASEYTVHMSALQLRVLAAILREVSR